MDFFRAQFTKIPRIHPVNLSQSTVLITGANAGIGLETAREVLKSRPQKLILACRDIRKGNEAKASLQNADRESPTTNIEVHKLDQSDFESVQSFTKGLGGQKVDIAILNAGVFSPSWSTTPDGYETDLQVNVLSSALLSMMLLPNLELASASATKREPSRLSIVSSGLHEMAKFKESELPSGQILNALNDRARYNQQDRYPTSKTLGLLWTRELASRISSDKVIINAPNPGFCKTGLMGNTTGFTKILVQIFSSLFGRSAPDGARCILNAAIVQSRDSHGKYLTETKVKNEDELTARVRDSKLQKRVWDEVVEHLRQKNIQLTEP